MRALTVFFAITALGFTACGDDDGSNGGNGGDESTVSVTADGETYVLEGMAVTSNGGIQINGTPSDTHNAQIIIVCNDLGATTYGTSDCEIQFTESDGTIWTNQHVDCNPEFSMEITEASPGLRATFSATFTLGGDPNCTSREFTNGVVDIVADDHSMY
jgi:hypothetical protein